MIVRVCLFLRVYAWGEKRMLLKVLMVIYVWFCANIKKFFRYLCVCLGEYDIPARAGRTTTAD